MARRKRISLGEDLGLALETRSDERPEPPKAPIARLAGDAAAEQGREIERLREAAGGARALERAEAEGRVLADVPLGEVDACFLHRDRMARADEDEARRALQASIRANGQRMPVELVRFARETAAGHRYGLISGFRRFTVLQRLHDETREARYATVRAMIREEAGLAPAFLAMVEENEVRANLSFYERGRVAALATKQGAFPDPDAAIEALFASASPAKRSKIRSFLTIHQTLGDLLSYPEEISERLGLKLARTLRTGDVQAIRQGLSGAETPRHAADEQKLILGIIAGGAGEGSKGAFDPGRNEVVTIPGGPRIERRSYADRAEIRITGEALDERRVVEALARVIAVFDRTG
jgi:ParB family chromosome partitioning protein